MTQSFHQILVVGVGNVLHGDDGFGVELAGRLMKRNDIPEAVKIIETGIGGMIGAGKTQRLYAQLPQSYRLLL